MAVLSSLHPDIAVLSNKNVKKKPKSVLFYNKTQVRVDVLNQIARLYSVKAESRQWPMHAFYDVINMALVNSWIIFTSRSAQAVSAIENSYCIQNVAEELTGTSGSATTIMPRKWRAEEIYGPSDSSATLIVKRRLTCSTSKCRNQITDLRQEYGKPFRVKCSSTKCD